MLTEAYTNTFCIVSIFARVELLNYLQVSGVYGLSTVAHKGHIDFFRRKLLTCDDVTCDRNL